MKISFDNFYIIISSILNNDINYMDFKVEDKVIKKWYKHLDNKNVLSDFRYVMNYIQLALYNYKENGFIVD